MRSLSLKRFKLRLTWPDLANPLAGFFLTLFLFIILAIIGGVYYPTGFSFPFSLLACALIVAGSMAYVVGVYMGSLFVNQSARLRRYLEILSTASLLLAFFMVSIFLFVASVFPWQLTLLIIVSLFVLMILSMGLKFELVERMLIELGIIFLVLSFILWGIIPALSSGFPSAPELTVIVRTTPTLLVSYGFFLFGTILLMADGKSWTRIFGTASALLGTLLFYWAGLWYLIAGIWITVFIAVRCYNAISKKGALLIVLGGLVVFFMIAALSTLFQFTPVRSRFLSIFNLAYYFAFVFELVIASSNLWVGTTMGGVLFGVPDGRFLMLNKILEKTGLGGPFGIDSILFGAPLMDFGIIGVVVFSLFLGFILSVGYQAVSLSAGESKKIMVGAYSSVYAFSLISVVRGLDFISFLLLVGLFAVSLRSIGESTSILRLRDLEVRHIHFLLEFSELGTLVYGLLFDDDKEVVRFLKDMGFVRVERDLVRMTPVGRLAVEKLREESGYT